MDDPLAIILAAGMSKRMKSRIPKVIHPICGRPLIEYILDSARAAGVKRFVAVVGHEAEMVKAALSRFSDVDFALQAERKGTGHAVMMCRDQLATHRGPVLVLAGDTPLLRSESLAGLLEDQRSRQAACVVGTAVTEANEGLGRIVRDSDGTFLRIVEDRDASPEEKAIREINTGCFVFDSVQLLGALGKLQTDNEQGEYYLTDCAEILSREDKTVVAADRLDIAEAIGVNDRTQLADVERAIQRHVLQKLMLDGVTVVIPEQSYVDARAKIGRDTVILPFTSIVGEAVIGTECRIGPHAAIRGPVNLPDGSIIDPFETAGYDD